MCDRTTCTTADTGPLAPTATPRPILGTPVAYRLSNMRPNLGAGLLRISFQQVPAAST